MANNRKTPLITRLSSVFELSSSDIRAIEALENRAVRVAAKSELVEEFDAVSQCGLLVDGWAIRQKMLADGRRQVVDAFPGGTFFSLWPVGAAHSDHSVSALTDTRVVWFPPSGPRHLFRNHPTVGMAVLWTQVVEEALLMERILSLGRRTARERMAHILIEFGRRLMVRGLGSADDYELPVSQELLADLLGLSAVHVSRCLRSLEQDGLVVRSHRHIRLSLSPALYELANFDPRYLHEKDPPHYA